MKITYLIICSLCIIACTSSSSQSSQQIIDATAKKLLKDTRFHSATIAVYKDGKSLIHHYGELNKGMGNTPTNSSLYDIASVTKTFTGTLAAEAVLDGKLKLDDDIRQFLEGDYPNLSYKNEKITIQHLLTHRGGFPNFTPRGENKEAFFESLKEIIITYKPGSHYQYSNMAPELMAYILEKVYEMPYHDLVAQYIFKPNGMENARFSLEKIKKENIVVGYDGEKLVPKLKRNLWGGSAGLHATAADMVKYIQFQLSKNNTVVNESHKKLGKSPYDFDLGYYWNIVNYDGQTIYRHHGGTYGMQNWFMVFPKYNMGIVMLTNSSFEETGEILEELVEELYHKLKVKSLDNE